MNSLTIIVQGKPRPQPRAKGRLVKLADGSRRFIFYTPSSVQRWRGILAVTFKKFLLENKDSIMPSKPVSVSMTFIFRRPRKHYSSKNVLKPDAPLFVSKRPDLDNLEKAVLDMLKNVGFYNDDSQVVSISSSKLYYTPNSSPVKEGVAINISYLDDSLPQTALQNQQQETVLCQKS